MTKAKYQRVGLLPHYNKLLLIVCAVAFALCLAACAPQASSPTDASDDAAAHATTDDETTSQDTEFTWTAESDCATCHDSDVASFSDTNCPASLHADMQDQCMTCHDDPEMEKAHSKVTWDSEKKKVTLKRTTVTRDTCTPCHDESELAQKTADSTVLTDKNGTTVNPHDLPTNEEHGEVNCSSCHKLHTADAPAEQAQATCKNCHHADVYECGTCHAD